MDTTPREKTESVIKALGLTYRADFQPRPQPADKVKHPQLHWLITLERGKKSMQFEYHEGMRHVKGYKQIHKTKYDQRRWEECYRKTCETGKLYRPSESGEYFFSPILGPKTQPAPLLPNILYCIVLDAEVLNYSSYEEWAPELGFDPDSRKGEEVYRLCLKQSLALKQLVNDAELEQLREALQDF